MGGQVSEGEPPASRGRRPFEAAAEVGADLEQRLCHMITVEARRIAARSNGSAP